MKSLGGSRFLEVIKWLVVISLLAVAIIGNYFCQNCSLFARILTMLLTVVIASGAAAMTAKGKHALAFAREARNETYKIIWPTRQEALRTTIVVVAMTAVMSLVLWGLDGLLVRVVSCITTLRF